MSEEIRKHTETEMATLGMNDRLFRDFLNEKLSPESETYINSHTTIVNMRVHGKAPKTDILEDLLCVYPFSDRRFHFALRILAAKKPHVWGVGGRIWELKASGLPQAK